MSITTKLRDWAKHYGPTGCRDILMLADSIEAEVSDMQAFCDRLQKAAESREDVTLWGTDYVALPIDAEGEYIHFGDVLDQFGTPMTVYAMSDPDPDQGDCMLELITDGISDSTWVRARKMRHYHAPTVEDTLRDFAIDWESAQDGEDKTAVLKECAAKLRLAGEDE